jgi:hypothetical protein
MDRKTKRKKTDFCTIITLTVDIAVTTTTIK